MSRPPVLAYILKRLLWAVPTLLLLITVTFFLVHSAPGAPFDTERPMPEQIRAQLMAHYGLDQPVVVQFGNYLRGLARGDFGPSYSYKDFSVTELIATGFPVSARLGGLAMLVALAVGVTLGTLAALRQNRPADHGLMGAAMVGISIPNFVVAPVLVLAFAVYLQWLPAGGWGDGAWRHLVLPVTALALPQIAYIARLTRGSMIEVLRSPFIRTAHAKGLPQRIVVLRHALKPALLPVVSYLGPATAAVLTGSVVIEQIFGVPGLGRYFVLGALNRDYTLVMGAVIFYGALIIVLNLIVDLLYAVLDTRVGYR